MATTAFSGVLWHLRQAAFTADGATHSDGELLDRFRTGRDEAAFAALVRRHGPMVFGVCRRTLRNEADAEDAFQATFLVLARRAHAVRPADRVGYWLYGVAYNTARKARTINRRRLIRERRAGEERLTKENRSERSELHEALDHELSRLPEKFRATVVLCDLEGEPLKEVARRLDCPTGTVASRLARARDMLRQNLARRGLCAAALLTPAIAKAHVPSKLTMLTARAATGVVPASTHVLAITEGVIQAMFLSKVKFALAAIVATGFLVAGLGNGSMILKADQDKPAKPGAADPVKPVKPGADPVKPGADPAKPGDKPVKPGADPVKPGDKPVKPEKPGGADIKKAPGFSGTVKTVDAAKDSITLTATKGDQSVDRTFTVAKDAHVSIDGHEAKLADVKPGLLCSVKTGDDKTTAIAIGCEGPTLIGELKEIAADKKSVKVAVTVHLDKTDPKAVKIEEKTVKVADDVRVAVEGNKKATVADLKTGTSVMVHISADGERAVVIMSPAKGGGAEGPSVVGELKEVAADKKSLKVAVTVKDKLDPKSVKVEEKTIKLNDSTRFMVDGNKQSTVADLKPGVTVAVQLTKDGDQAVFVKAAAKGDGDKKPEKPVKPNPDKPVKPGEKPGAEKPVKPGADKPGEKKPVKDGDK